MSQFSHSLARVGRPVVDETGTTEKFDFHLEYAPDGVDPGDDLEAPSIFSALGQIGLKLKSIKGPRDFLIIDQVDRPSEN